MLYYWWALWQEVNRDRWLTDPPEMVYRSTKNNVGKSRLVENRTKYKEWLTKEYGECIDREKADVYYINDKMHGYKSYQERLKLYDEFIDALDNNKNELERDLIWQSTEQ